MAKKVIKKPKKVIVVDEDELDWFTFDDPGDTFEGFFESEDNDQFTFVDPADDKKILIEKIAAISQALDTPINGKNVRDMDGVLIEIVYKGMNSNGTEKLFKVYVTPP